MTEIKFDKRNYRKHNDKNKRLIKKSLDDCDNFDNRKTIVYARNVCFDLAKKLNKKYFVEFDDDYTDFEFRLIKDDKLKGYSIKDLNGVIESFLTFLANTKCTTIAFAQGGDLIGGKDNGRLKQGLLRKAMNSFFCDVDKQFSFIGRVNEDVNTYCLEGSRGKLFFTDIDVSLNQTTTQKNKGGMTDEYIDSGTYVKSFYSVMLCPSCVKLALMGDKHKRIHHNVSWVNAVPMIINERWKKCQNQKKNSQK